MTQSSGVLSAATVSFETLVRPGLKIQYEIPLKGAAEDLAATFPAVEAELVDLFGWHLSQRPTVMLIQNGEMFRRLADHPLIIAYAVPSEGLIVLDFGKLAGRPAQFRSVLKHEVVHLFLNVNRGNATLPKWLEEGVAQWASEGVADLLEQPQPSLLEDAILSGDLIPLSALRDRFPSDNRRLLLAYEESRRVVSYIAETHGRSTLIEILADIQRGSDVDAAFYRGLTAFPWEIERQWIARQNRGTVWLTYLAGHIYQFLFFLGALLTVAGFVRFRLKKRAYVDDE
ncbi:MAG: peptidase MA family metallohydrolase [Desulfobacterales bacterium]|nr:peptidase MA family metallohydrolase [Desulfobacterales bacterium]